LFLNIHGKGTRRRFNVLGTLRSSALTVRPPFSAIFHSNFKIKAAQHTGERERGGISLTKHYTTCEICSTDKMRFRVSARESLKTNFSVLRRDAGAGDAVSQLLNKTYVRGRS
jgi:hypothetical protein